MSLQIVWFKRDLRLFDHQALTESSQLGPILCLYIFEPSYWKLPDSSQRQFEFLKESLHDLDEALIKIGSKLIIMSGDVCEVFDRLYKIFPFSHIHSHEETGNNFTHQRDISLQLWAQSHNIRWSEYPQFAVIRRLKDRNLWTKYWSIFMNKPLYPIPHFTPAPLIDSDLWPQWHKWNLIDDRPSKRQTGGRTEGLRYFNDFLMKRSGYYRGGLSSPLSATTACSRLSPYLSLGCLSMREIIQKTEKRLDDLPLGDRMRNGLNAFISRLHWHCHFIQKLESEPQIEWHNMHRGYDGLRENDWNHDHFERLKAGKTGWPLVDASIEMLKQTGWLNFRMRAMLVSIAAYPLWLHWKPVGDWLAGLFVDYEPGIHWSQMQMQSGTTGINATRIYNPIKQARDHDPEGVFVRQWLPILKNVPDCWIFEPWKMPLNVQQSCQVIIGRDWPIPPVDLLSATIEAKRKIYERKGSREVRSEKEAVLEKHGSRRQTRQKRRQSPSQKNNKQLSFDF
jgi:deoxyribodipyrimidine photo-lyase